ncbi:MAG TPA: hypothetical protein VLE48_10695 [Terriglobales bacterium]|nr:hypothetical protein [Terriglobales bacterium]
MQFAKDTFYVALRDRLAALNPARIVFLDGVNRPAVIVAENEPATSTGALLDAFYVVWGAVRAVESAARSLRPLLALDCAIVYRTRGTDDMSGVDRGRMLATLDIELLQIFSPHGAPKLDYTQTAPIDLGTSVFWLPPQLAEPVNVGGELRRTARTTVYFFPEADLA